MPTLFTYLWSEFTSYCASKCKNNEILEPKGPWNPESHFKSLPFTCVISRVAWPKKASHWHL